MTDVETHGTSLTVRRTFHAPCERLSRAFTDRRTRRVVRARRHDRRDKRLEPEVGSLLDLSMLGEDGSHDAAGTFTDIVENERLIPTWTWTHHDEPVEARIIVELHDIEDGTEVVLTHEGHPDAETVQQHAEG